MAYLKEAAIICLTILEGVAIASHEDRIFFLPVAGLIGYIAGLKTDKVASLITPGKPKDQ